MSATEPWSDWIDVSVILDLYSENMSRYGGFPSIPYRGALSRRWEQHIVPNHIQCLT